MAPWRTMRNRWLLLRGRRKARRWWRPRTWPIAALYALLTVLYGTWIVRELLPHSVLRSTSWLSDQGWREALTVLGLSATTVVAAVWFVLWRFRRARRYYLRKARSRPEELVKPGSIIERVVGRDRLCDALMDDLRQRKTRRPHVIVGAIGVGKTALLVRLTERLAAKGVTPVVLQLRDVTGNTLDFEQLAADKFKAELLDRVFSGAEAEKVWMRLRYRQDRVVVLADGLEDALKNTPDRDTKIRKAISDAREAKLPLVLTSRPQKSLQALNAAQTVLEPLSEEAALEYVAEDSSWRTDRQRMDWVVEAADVAESPLYLNIARELEAQGLLERIVGAGEDEYCDPRDQDVWALRYDLLDAWVQALVDGHLRPEQPLSYYGRSMTVEYLSALACAALRTNSTFVRYDALRGPAGAEDTGQDSACAALTRQLSTMQSTRDAQEKSGIDERLAGSWGSRLGLVEERDDGVRFQHSVLQAFLASRYMHALIHGVPEADPPEAGLVAAGLVAAEPLGTAQWLRTMTPTAQPETASVCTSYFEQALQRPGRELSMALVFYSRSMKALKGCRAQHCPAPESTPDQCPIGTTRRLLWDAAHAALAAGRPSWSGTAAGAGTGAEAGAEAADSCDVEQDPRIRALEMYSSALDVDSFHHSPQHHEIAQDLCTQWQALDTYNDTKLDATKKALVKRIGATARLLSNRKAVSPHEATAVTADPSYDVLFDIAVKEPSHEVRFAVAQAIGEGGDDAFRQLEGRLTPQSVRRPGARRERLTLSQDLVDEVFNAFVLNAFVAGLGLAEPAGSTGVAGGSTGVAGGVFFAAPDFDGPTAAPGTTRTERMLRKTRAELLETKRLDEEHAEQQERTKKQALRREDTMRAWLVPMLVRSCTAARHQHTPYDLLLQWMKQLDGNAIDLGLQAALAQGFRLAANHRTPATQPATTHDFLKEQAWEMLKRTRFWYARLALLQALTLWALPDDVARRQPRHGHGASPAKQVRQWLRQTDSTRPDRGRRQEHPLVKAAGKQARRALLTRRPDRFVWIDESGMAAQIGAETTSPREPRRHNLWVPPSTGWSTLDPGAQQLLADVLVLLTLTEERGDRPEEAEARLEQSDRADPPLLPPCLARDRAPLDPARALVGEAPGTPPGSNCADGCPFELCPYPPKGPQCRTELTELFCIHQRSMLDRTQWQAWRYLRFRRKADWQRGVTVASLREFWDEMGARARDRALKEATRNPHDRW